MNDLFSQTPLEKLQHKLRSLFRRLPDEQDIAPQLFPHRPPPITIGSIVLSTIIRTAAVMIISWFVVLYFKIDEHWWLPLFTLWLIAVYPAYRKYDRYREVHNKLAGDTLCATCKHYNSAGMVCSIYDEHVNTNYIPCGGLAWEAKRSSEGDV